MAVKFAYDSDDKQFVYGDNLCGDWISLGSWPTSVTGPTTSSTQYHFISSPSPLRLSPGFTEVCIVNTCGNCKCPNVIQFIGQLEIRGFSTSTPLGIPPFRLRAEAVDDGGDSQITGDWILHAETSFVDMLNCVVSVNLFIMSHSYLIRVHITAGGSMNALVERYNYYFVCRLTVPYYI